MSDIIRKQSQGRDIVIIIDRDLCKGCDICVKVCKTGALELEDASDKWEGAVVAIKDVEQCNFCRLCEIQCPDFAIRVLRKEEEASVKLPVETKKTAAE
ncbi:MAG: 4Fe-4S dicluster domain-containing protein [Candidatus Zixiibacteriota bacterium]|nr:MAG: 4Fe-4S dicluster domain-containing protein [candidate division Zixibacteria bacterium]